MTSEPDEILRISVVIHKELDPDVFVLLKQFSSARPRSEFARRLMREGAIKEMKSRPKKSSLNNSSPPKSAPAPAGSPEPKGHKPRSVIVTQATPPADAPAPRPVNTSTDNDAFIEDFVGGILAVPKR